MAYILKDLLNVRQHREDKALNHLIQRKAEVSRCASAKHRKERQLEEFRQWREVREKSLFDQLQSEPASLNDLMCYTDAVGTMRRDQADKARQVVESAERLAKAETEHQAARQSHARACLKKTKIEAHKNIWMDHDRVKRERHEEKEIEELGNIIPIPI